MKSRKALQIFFFIVFLTVFLAFGQAKICAQGQEKQWIAIHEQIPEGSARYKIKLKYIPSESAFFYSSSRSNVVRLLMRRR
jgi:hypothetical protein